MSQLPDDRQGHSSALLAPSSAASLSFPPLLQLPADLLSLVYPYLPWHERVLHASHVHGLLPPSWLVWSESDHVPLSDSFLSALAELSPSAVQCCRCVQSLSVNPSIDEELMHAGEEDDQQQQEEEGGREEDRAVEDRVVQPPAWLPPASRLQQCVVLVHLYQSVQQQQRLQRRPLQFVLVPPFSNVRFLITTPTVLYQLLDCTQLPNLHSLALYAFGGEDDEEQEQQATARSLSDRLRSLPSLRRLRVDRMHVAYRDLLSIAGLELLDLGNAGMIDVERDEASRAPPSLSLRRVMLVRFDHEPVHDLLASLLPTSLQQLDIRGRLTNDNLRTLTQLQSLTAVGLLHCHFDDTNALGRLLSDNAEPLLPNLHSFTIDECDADEIDFNDMRTSTAAFLTAYSRQLRHIKLAVKTDPANSLAAVLSVIVSHMPQLETLELAVRLPSGSTEVVGEIVVENRANEPQRLPTLHSLRSLTLRNLHMSDAGVAQLLSYCPHLLELTVDRVALLTASLWFSLLQCRRLL